MSNSPSIDRREMSFAQKLSIPESQSPPWTFIDLIIVLVAYLMTLFLLGPAIATIILGESITPLVVMLGWTIGTAIAILFVIISRRSTEASRKALKLDKASLPLPFLLLLGVAIGISADLIVGLISGIYLPIPELVAVQVSDPFSLMVGILFVVLIQPVAESLIFQGVIQPKLRWTLGAWGGIALTTLIYTIIHYGIFYSAFLEIYPAQAGIWYGVILPLLSGLAFCLVRVYTDSTRAVIITRMGAGLLFLLTSIALVG